MLPHPFSNGSVLLFLSFVFALVACFVAIDNVFLAFGVFVAETPAFRRGEEADPRVFPPLTLKGVCFDPVRRYTLKTVRCPSPMLLWGFL